jgi:hypothetical protein
MPQKVVNMKIAKILWSIIAIPAIGLICLAIKIKMR